MATISARRTAAAGTDTRTAGGKMLRSRRQPPASRTPYSRPPTPPPEAEEEVGLGGAHGNPNWLSGLIYPAKVIASGAGKILSFFGNDDDESSSEEEGDEDENDDDEEVDNDGSDKVSSPSTKSAKKRKIEQLVTEETFSREEGNELIKLVKSRIMDTNQSFGESTPRARTTAIMEAKKWLQEKRSGSKKKSEIELDATPSQFARSEKGSPVDMAKSYMQSRPSWASPSLKQAEFESPSTLGKLSFKEETPQSTLRSLELKKSSFTSGSWNLFEEIRRVRSKATEQLLAATPLTKTSLAAFPHNRVENVSTDAAVNHSSRAGQDGDAVQSVEHQEHLEVVDLKSNEDDVNGITGLAQGENGSLVGSGEGGYDVHMDETLNPHQEPVDAPSSNPTEPVVNGSQNSSSLQQEDLSQERSQPTLDSSLGKVKDTQKERKSRGYTRRGRGRAK